MKSKLLLLELNELNFEYIERYIAQGKLPAFKKLLDSHGLQYTTSEEVYENIEPWIQWITAHTGLSYDEHGVFRLGDIVNYDLPQIWEDLEGRGLRVGAVSPMNARQRMRDPAFFLPDPWTETDIVAPRGVRRFYNAVAQMVNQNAGGRGGRNLLIDLALGSAYCAQPENYMTYLGYAMRARSKPWNRALVLDLLLSDLFVKFVRKHDVDFASLFLNSAAHIQHHYMFSSSVYDGKVKNPEWYVRGGYDPLYDIYQLYDRILASIIRQFPDRRIMIATGLHQIPYPEESFYWRLSDHKAFLREIGVPFVSVAPRMSRDFLVECEGPEQALAAAQRLAAVSDLDRLPIFEIDNRGSSLFVTLSYRYEIKSDMRYLVGNEERIGLGEAVSFVAIKNGHHDGIGYFVDTGAERISPSASFPLKELPDRIRAVVL